MRRVLALALLAISFSLIVPALASADLRSSQSMMPSFTSGQGGYIHQIGIRRFFRNLFGWGKKGSRNRSGGQQNVAPELDVTGVGSAAILLIGGSLVLMDRRRRTRKRSNRPRQAAG